METGELHAFNFATDDLGAAGDNTIVFDAKMRIHVVEIGTTITTDLVPGAVTVDVYDVDITSVALGGVTGSRTTAPARGAASATLTTSSTDVTHEVGVVLTEKVDFTMEKGELLTVQMTGTPTSGNGVPYILYHFAGQSLVEAGEQRGAEAAE